MRLNKNFGGLVGPVSCLTLLAILGCGVVVPQMNEASALTCTGTGTSLNNGECQTSWDLSFTVQKYLELEGTNAALQMKTTSDEDITPTADGVPAVASRAFTVKTNSTNGFNMNVKANESTLNGPSNSKIAGLETTGALIKDSWGVYAGATAPSVSSNFYAPATDTNIYTPNTSTNGSNTVYVGVGAKISNGKVAGDYSQDLKISVTEKSA